MPVLYSFCEVDIRSPISDGIKLAEDSFSKMAVSVKPVITSDIAQQQLELEEQRRNIKQQVGQVLFG